MPKFETVPVAEIKAVLRMSEPRKKKLETYVGYINQLSDDKGGKLTCSPSENVTTVRNDLKLAAQMAGKNLKIRRSGNIISFYIEKRRGGRKKKS
jgi:hypothetical protein